MDENHLLAQKFATILPHLNEKQRRLLLAAEAQALGYGGITQVAQAAGLSRATIHKALQELAAPTPLTERVRRRGGGRKSALSQDPTLVADLEALLDPATRGDPMSPLRWTCKSIRQLTAALNQQGHAVSEYVVRHLLYTAGYSLQANAKTREGHQHADRDEQFQYLNAQVKAFLDRGLPVLSVDAKKKELVGAFKNGGREWQPQGAPEQVQVHDFPAKDGGKAIPYGIYDVGRNSGWVSVGQDHDTASFAVASLRRWWEAVGRQVYPQGERLLICADGDGSNSYRLRLWKVELQNFANATGLVLTVCHLPPGTSKWNKIEHRLFAYISMNWRGRPLVSHEVIVELIGATSNREGLQVQAERDTASYPTGVKVTDEQLAALEIRTHPFHGEWNYTIIPTAADIKL